MKALTLWQPWAWAVAHAGKDVENRTWAPPRSIIGQRIAIHAGKRYDEEAWTRLTDPHVSPVDESRLDEKLGLFVVPDKHNCVRGAIVATATVAGCRRLDGPAAYSPWHSGPIGWTLADVVALPVPVECRGAQGLWEVPRTIEALVNAGLAAQRRADSQTQGVDTFIPGLGWF